MKRLCSLVILAAIGTGGSVTGAAAADATAALDVNTAYVWRGLTFNDGFVLQPSLDVAVGGFAFNVWGNFDLDDYNGTLDSGEFSEVDLTASYALALGSVEASFGVIEYLFPAGGDSTTELFAGLGMDLGAGFSVSATLYYDVDQVDDLYATAALDYSYSISDPLTLGATGMVSYAGQDFAEYYAGGTDGGFFNYLLGASLDYAISEALTVGARINYGDSLDDDVLPDDSVDTTLFGGLNVTYAF